MQVGNCTDDSTYYIASGAPGGDDDKIIKEVGAGKFDVVGGLNAPITVRYFADPEGENQLGVVHGLSETDQALLIQCGTNRFGVGLSPAGY